jgi:hypothetical protein
MFMFIKSATRFRNTNYLKHEGNTEFLQSSVSMPFKGGQHFGWGSRKWTLTKMWISQPNKFKYSYAFLKHQDL